MASHPVALAQCRKFFAEHPDIEAVAAYDTAGAVQDLLRPGGPVTQAAIGSGSRPSSTAARSCMTSIEDDPQNFTRFLLLAREPGPIEAANKTSVVFTLKNVPGALYGALGAFATPRRGPRQDRVAALARAGPGSTRSTSTSWATRARRRARPLEVLEGLSGEFRILGSYPDGLQRLRAQ